MNEERIHPIVSEAKSKFEQGRISRRDFLRFACLLGVSVTTARFLSGCTPENEPQISPTTAATKSIAPDPTATTAPVIKRGGTYRIATQVPSMVDPATAAWAEGTNITRNVCEYLTYIDEKGIAHPWLLESWSANDSIDEWTLKVRQGIKFNDGSDFDANDVVFNLKRWLDPELASGMLGNLSPYLSADGIELIDNYTIKLHYTQPNICFPEHVYENGGQILSRNFGGDIIKQPVGTGPFLLETYQEKQTAVLKRRPDYWQKGKDGQPLPYLDEIVYYDLGADHAAWLAALQAKQVDRVLNAMPEQLEAYRQMDHVKIVSGATGSTYVVRMGCDVAPFNDNRVRQALKMCQDRQKMMQLAHYGEGVVSTDAHVSPIHPGFVEKPTPAYNPEGARKLLAEAGYPDGLKVTITAMSNSAEGVMATALKEMAAPGGFDLSVDLVPSDVYWNKWTEVPLGVTVWGQRPLETQVLRLAYTADPDGKPASWNETKWIDKEFDTILAQAEQTLDIEERKKLISQLMDIQIERGSVGISFWRNNWVVTDKKYQDIPFEPNNQDNFASIWYDPDA